MAFADVYTVFAKIDGDKFTGFIVERGFEGFSQGPEEHKMGIKGSSTVQLYFRIARYPWKMYWAKLVGATLCV